MMFSYSELVEVHRTYEATATPEKEGANLSDFDRSMRGFECM